MDETKQAQHDAQAKATCEQLSKIMEGTIADLKARITDTARTDLIAKLEPLMKGGEYSPKMVAITACILSEPGKPVVWTRPQLMELCITSDYCVLGRRDGDPGFNDFLGAGKDLDRNLAELLTRVNATAIEAAYVIRKLIASQVATGAN